MRFQTPRQAIASWYAYHRLEAVLKAETKNQVNSVAEFTIQLQYRLSSRRM